MSDKKISIILPVYNVEKYLRQCLDSLCEQTMPEHLEIIAVNDGSTDSSPQILREYEKEHPGLFRIFDLENQGVSHARNFGVSQALGEYILFVDSDDYIEPTMCECLYEKAVKDNDDVVICCYYNVVEDELTHQLSKTVGKAYPVKYEKDFSVQERPYELVHISPFPWDKLYRKSLIERFPFPEGLRFEDLSIMYQTMCSAGRIGVVPDALYNYRRSSSGSFLNSLSEQTLDLIPSLSKMIQAMKDNQFYTAFYEEIEYICIRHIFVRFNMMFDTEKIGQDRGKMNVKKRIVTECLGFLDNTFPNWRDNRYLKYTASVNNRKMKHVYENRKRTLKKLRHYEYTPGPVIRGYLKARKKTADGVKFWSRSNRMRRLFRSIKEKLVNFKNNFFVFKLIFMPRDVRYTRMLCKYPVSEQVVLFESKHGDDVAGNIFYMLKALQKKKYSHLEICLALRPSLMNRWSKVFENYNMKGIRLIKYNSREYLKCLATAKYLITDTSFAGYFIKRDEQVYLNTWHGTPLKQMGRSVPNREYALGNVQRNFFIADYLLYQNEFSRDIFLDDYMVREIYNGKVLLTGYPRNSALFNWRRRVMIRLEMHLEKKKVMVYMPTWRGLLTQKENAKQIEMLTSYFYQLDRNLTDDQVLFVKLHPYVKLSVNYSEFDHIRPFPKQYETYDFLNASDILITDYSSIMFDYAATGKKIVLFTYDREEYLDTRGMYVDLEGVELPKADTVEELLKVINSEEPFEYPEFKKRFSPYDDRRTADEVCAYLFLQEMPENVSDEVSEEESDSETDRAEDLTQDADATAVQKSFFYVEDVEHNGKKNVLMLLNGLAGGKKKIEEMNRYNTEKYNYYYCMKSESIKSTGKVLAQLRKDMYYIPLTFDVNYTLRSRLTCFLAFRLNRYGKRTDKVLDELAKIEYRKYFGNADFEVFVNVNNRDRILHHVGGQFKGVRIYNWAEFDAERYGRDKEYRKLVKYLIKHMGKYQYLIGNEALFALCDRFGMDSQVKRITAPEENFSLEDTVERILKENNK